MLKLRTLAINQVKIITKTNIKLTNISIFGQSCDFSNNLLQRNYKINFHSLEDKNTFLSPIVSYGYNMIKHQKLFLNKMEEDEFFEKEDIEYLKNTKNAYNKIFCINCYLNYKHITQSFVSELTYLYNFVDDRALNLISQKLFSHIKNNYLLDLDILLQKILEKGFKNYEIVKSMKNIILFDDENMRENQKGNALMNVRNMGILTKDQMITNVYSDTILSGLNKLNFNDILICFDGLSTLKNVDPLVWKIIEHYIVKKFNKLYKFNTLRKLSIIIDSTGMKNCLFWIYTDKFIALNINNQINFNFLFEISILVQKNIDKMSIDFKNIINVFLILFNKRHTKSIKSMVDLYLHATKISTENTDSFIECNTILEKIKTIVKFAFEKKLEILTYDDISFLFTEEYKELLSNINTTLVGDKQILNLLDKFDEFPDEQKFKIYFEMGKHDNRLLNFTNKIKFHHGKSFLISEFYIMTLIKILTEYEKDSHESSKIFSKVLQENLNEVLDYNLNINFYEFLIASINVYPNILKYISPELKKKKLNKIVNSFIEYKNKIFKKKFILNETSDPNSQILKKFTNEFYEFDYDKLIIVSILNKLNKNKLNSNQELIEILDNSRDVYIEIKKSGLMEKIRLIYNLNLSDLEKLYNFKFYEDLNSIF